MKYYDIMSDDTFGGYEEDEEAALFSAARNQVTMTREEES